MTVESSSTGVATLTERAVRLPSLSFVYPMYNEKDIIGRTVAESLRIGPQLAERFEIVIVDDASTDGCGEIVEELARQHPEVRVLHHAKNRKLGGTLRTGFAAATMDWILYIDSDMPINMDETLAALPLAQTADIIIGWRSTPHDSLKREIMSTGYNRLIRLLFGLKVIDVNFSFKLFKRAFMENITLQSEGSFIDAELLIEMQRNGARFAELGLKYYPRTEGESTLAGWGVIRTLLGEMMKYYRARQ